MKAGWLHLNVIWRGKIFPRAILTTCLWSALIIFRLMIIKRVWSSQHHIPLIPYIPLLLPLCSTSEPAFLFLFQCGVVLINHHVHQHTLWHWDKCTHCIQKAFVPINFQCFGKNRFYAVLSDGQITHISSQFGDITLTRHEFLNVWWYSSYHRVMIVCHRVRSCLKTVLCIYLSVWSGAG